MEPILWHVKNVICNGDERLDEYIWNWWAYLVQKPEKKPQTILILKSTLQQCGKNIITDFISWGLSEENPSSDHVTADLIGEDRLMLEDNITSVTINAQEGEDNHSQNQISLEKSDASRLLPNIPEEFQIALEATGDDWMQSDMTRDIQGEIEWEDFIG